jgi:membrane protease YdiL (CAAX protease family)
MYFTTQPTMPRTRAALTALCLVFAATTVFWLCDGQDWRWLDSGTLSGLFKIAIWVVPSVIATCLVFGGGLGSAFERMGLRDSPARGLLFGLAATVPMAIATSASGVDHTTRDYLIGTALIGPFAEEVLFRGFLFQTLMTRAGWPAAWAAAASALAFGVAHVGGWFAGSLLFAVMVPALAGVVFAWVFYRTGNLWTAVGLHGCLNLWSTLSHGEGVMRIASRPDSTSIAQGLSLVIAVLLAERIWRRRAAIARPHP